MFYYERYRKGYKFKELDYSDIGDAATASYKNNIHGDSRLVHSKKFNS